MAWICAWICAKINGKTDFFIVQCEEDFTFMDLFDRMNFLKGTDSQSQSQVEVPEVFANSTKSGSDKDMVKMDLRAPVALLKDLQLKYVTFILKSQTESDTELLIGSCEYVTRILSS